MYLGINRIFEGKGLPYQTKVVTVPEELKSRVIEILKRSNAFAEGEQEELEKEPLKGIGVILESNPEDLLIVLDASLEENGELLTLKFKGTTKEVTISGNESGTIPLTIQSTDLKSAKSEEQKEESNTNAA